LIGPAMAAAAPPSAAVPEPPVAARPASIPATTPTPAVAIRQTMPLWPRTVDRVQAVGASAEGMVRVRIGADGRVKEAKIARPLHPQYDMQVLVAAYRWLYKPAMLNGVPVESDSEVLIRVIP
jgi:periplasmic protein TonB